MRTTSPIPMRKSPPKKSPPKRNEIPKQEKDVTSLHSQSPSSSISKLRKTTCEVQTFSKDKIEQLEKLFTNPWLTDPNSEYDDRIYYPHDTENLNRIGAIFKKNLSERSVNDWNDLYTLFSNARMLDYPTVDLIQSLYDLIDLDDKVTAITSNCGFIEEILKGLGIHIEIYREARYDQDFVVQLLNKGHSPFKIDKTMWLKSMEGSIQSMLKNEWDVVLASFPSKKTLKYIGILSPKRCILIVNSGTAKFFKNPDYDASSSPLEEMSKKANKLMYEDEGEDFETFRENWTLDEKSSMTLSSIVDYDENDENIKWDENIKKWDEYQSFYNRFTSVLVYHRKKT